MPTPTSKTPSTRLTTPTLNTAGLSAQEIKDRQAIQIAWIKYWDITRDILATPKAQRGVVLSAVATADQVKKIMGQIAIFEKNGWDNYGTVVHHLYWGPPVDGQDSAVMGDCIDSSKAGRKNAKTGQPLTVGIPKDNARASFVRQANGKWVVIDLQFLTGTTC